MFVGECTERRPGGALIESRHEFEQHVPWRFFSGRLVACVPETSLYNYKSRPFGSAAGM